MLTDLEDLKPNGNATTLDDIRPAIDTILCLSTLVGHKVLSKDASFDDAGEWFTTSIGSYCPNCTAFEHCPVCILEE